MDIFDRISEQVVSVGKTASQKAKGVYDVAKLQTELREAKDALEAVYAELGKKYYEEKNGKKGYDFSEVEAAKARVEELKNQINGIKGTVTCDKCGASVPEGASFCPTCGAKIGENTEE